MCLLGQLMSFHISALYSFLVNKRPLCGSTTFCLAIHHLMGIYVVSAFWVTYIQINTTTDILVQVFI